MCRDARETAPCSWMREPVGWPWWVESRDGISARWLDFDPCWRNTGVIAQRNSGGKSQRVGGGRIIPAEWTSSRPRARRAQQAAGTLRSQILAGAFADGVLPDERSLGSELGASRNAVREALGVLREEGLIVRRQGVGTTVATPKYGHGLDQLAGLAEALTGCGTVVNVVRSARVLAPAPAAVAEKLSLAPSAGVVHIERLRRLGGMPLSFDETYLTRDVGEPLLGCDLSGRDLFALIEDVAGSALGSADVTVDAVTASPEIAALLEIPTASAVFAIQRLTHLADGRPVDVEWIHVRADRLSLHATLYRSRTRPAADPADTRAGRSRDST